MQGLRQILTCLTKVYSDTLGVIARRDGRSILTKPTLKWPFFMQYLCRWVGAASTEPFRFSSISLNCDYGAVRHRDSNNIGPSLTRWPNTGFAFLRTCTLMRVCYCLANHTGSLGDFVGGNLIYWAKDATPLNQTHHVLMKNHHQHWTQ